MLANTASNTMRQSRRAAKSALCSLVSILPSYMSEGGADAVVAGVTSSDDDDITILGREAGLVDVISHLLLLPCLEELHSEVDALQLPSGDRQVARPRGSRAEDRGVVLSQKLLQRRRDLVNSIPQ